MSFQRVDKTVGLRLLKGAAQRFAVLASLIAILLAPVVSGGLLSGSHVRAASALDAQSTGSLANEPNPPQQKNLPAGEAARRKQIAEDSAELLKMATGLKAEVDKTNKDTLSVSVIRRAGTLEKLARDLKEKMRASLGMN